MMVLLDLTKSPKSQKRKADPSESKSTLQLSLEKPIKTAILLSLVGVESIVANQWPTLLQDNALKAITLWDNLLAFGKPLGKTVRLIQRLGNETINPDEVPQASRDEIFSELQPPRPSALGLVLYGLPHQAIV